MGLYPRKAAKRLPDRQAVGDPVGDDVRHSLSRQPLEKSGEGRVALESGDHEGEEEPDGQVHRRVWKVARMPDATPRSAGRHRVHDACRVGGGEAAPSPRPLAKRRSPKGERS